MPAIVTCSKVKGCRTYWNAASDDCVLPSLLSITIGLFNISLLSAALCVLYFRPVCVRVILPPLLSAPLFTLLAIKTAIQLNEGLILIVSSRGAIVTQLDIDPRKKLISKVIYIRIFLALCELATLVSAMAGVFHPSVTSISTDQCNEFGVGLYISQAVVMWLVLVYLGFVVKSMYCIDPLGCFSPGLLEYLPLFDQSDKRGSMTGYTPTSGIMPQHDNADSAGNDIPISSRVHIWSKHRGGGVSTKSAEQIERQCLQVHNNQLSTQKMERRLRAICCCLGVKGQRSRGIALEEVARGLYTLFDGTDVTLTDVIAGFILTKQHQRRTIREGTPLTDKFRRVTFRMMSRNQRFGQDPEILLPDQPFDFSDLSKQMLFDDLIYYMNYAMGVYGWPLYVFDNLACGLCELGLATCCRCNYRCFVRRAEKDFPEDDCCLCAVGALKLSTGLNMNDILYYSLDNNIYKAPFSVCVDRQRKAVVVSVRGTLSLKDALTDMSFTPIYVTVQPVKETFVHGGMLKAAIQIHKVINDKALLDEVFVENPDYQLVVTGHSLGAGAASVLALLFKLENKYPTMVCYAFSPPGCLFSFPLAVYCKDFITSVVLGNDMVPRLTLRSLLHLKFNVSEQLKKCNKPKYRVLFGNNFLGQLHDFISKPTTSSVPTDGSYGVDEVDGEQSNDIEERVLNTRTTNDWMQDQLFSRPVSTEPDSSRVQRTISRLFSRSPSARPSQIELAQRLQRSLSIQPARPTLQPPSIIVSQGEDEVDSTSGHELPSSLFQGTENDIYPSELATPGTSIHRAIPDMHQHCRARNGESFLPLFPGGHVLHIEIVKPQRRTCCPCFSDTCYTVNNIPNDKLCVIQIEHGIIDHHLPTNMLAALNQCQKIFLLPNPKYNYELIKQKRAENASSRRQIHLAANRKGSFSTGFNFMIGSTNAGHSKLVQSLKTPDNLHPEREVGVSPNRDEGFGLAAIEEESQHDSSCQPSTIEVSVEVHSHDQIESVRVDPERRSRNHLSLPLGETWSSSKPEAGSQGHHFHGLTLPCTTDHESAV